jgi:hypothetical protein
MALRAVPETTKFANLSRILKMPKYKIMGILETLWHFAGKNSPQGNIGKYSNEEIAAWIGWEGEPEELINALGRSKWIDRDKTHRLLVHDWADHADNATKMALGRKKLQALRHDGTPWSDEPKPLPLGTYCAHSVETPPPQRGDSVEMEWAPPGPGPEPVPGPGAGPVPVPGPEPVPDKPDSQLERVPGEPAPRGFVASQASPEEPSDEELREIQDRLRREKGDIPPGPDAVIAGAIGHERMLDRLSKGKGGKR